MAGSRSLRGMKKGLMSLTTARAKEKLQSDE